MSPMRALAICLTLAVVIPAAEIPQGSHLLLRMMNTINSRTAQEGDYVYMQTATPVAVDNHVVVPPGTYVQGVVSHVKKSGKVSGTAELGIRLETLTMTGGKSYRFAPKLSSVDAANSGQAVDKQEDLVRQAPEKGKDVARIAIIAGTGASIGGIVDSAWKGAGIGAGIGGAVGLATVLITRGSPVQLRSGSTLDVVFDRPVVLE
jgi:hypothetical protein